MGLFDTLGFQWNRDSVPREIPRASLERVVFRFHRMLPEYVWDVGVLEGNPFTFPEVKTPLEGVTVGGRKHFDQEQILNLAESSKHLAVLVKAANLHSESPRSVRYMHSWPVMKRSNGDTSEVRDSKSNSPPKSRWGSVGDLRHWP
jgi:hypothetical protein